MKNKKWKLLYYKIYTKKSEHLHIYFGWTLSVIF